MLFSAPALATTILTAVSGASNYTISDTSDATTKPKVYAGVVTDGSASLCSNSQVTATCNTCAESGASATTVIPCNKSAISPNGYLFLEGKTDNTQSLTQQPFLRISASSGSSTPVENPLPDQSGIFHVLISWSEVCNMVTGDSSCLSSGSQTLQFGLGDSEKVDIQFMVSAISTADTSIQFYTPCGSGGSVVANDGFCNVSMFPGDGKVYAESLQLANSSVATPSSGINYNGLVFFYEAASADDASSRATALSAIRSTSSSSSISYNNSQSPPDVDGRITGLDNQTTYCFVMANQDETGNIYKATNVGSSTLPSGALMTDVMCARPDEVVGLLDDKRCFIATAAFGSPFEIHVKTLRLFRDKILKSSAVGEAVVDFYYSWSPVAAKWIASRDHLRAAVRVGLVPFVGFAELSLHYGFLPVFAVLLLLGGLVMFAALAWRRRRVK